MSRRRLLWGTQWELLVRGGRGSDRGCGVASPRAQLERQPTRPAWMSAGASLQLGCKQSPWRGLCLPGGGGGGQARWEAGVGRPPGHLPPSLLLPQGAPVGFSAPKSALTPSGHCPRLQEPSRLSCLAGRPGSCSPYSHLDQEGWSLTPDPGGRAGGWTRPEEEAVGPVGPYSLRPPSRPQAPPPPPATAPTFLGGPDVQ